MRFTSAQARLGAGVSCALLDENMRWHGAQQLSAQQLSAHPAINSRLHDRDYSRQLSAFTCIASAAKTCMHIAKKRVPLGAGVSWASFAVTFESQCPLLVPSLALMSSVLDACTRSPTRAAIRKHATPGNRTSALLMRSSCGAKSHA